MTTERTRHFYVLGVSIGAAVALQSTAIERRIEAVVAEHRAIPGHWEGDLLAGGKNSYIATLVERHSRFLMLIKAPSKDTAVVVATFEQTCS